MTLVLRQPMPPLLRALLAVFGAFCVAAPAWELREGVLQPSLWALPFAAIVLGAWVVGGLFLLAAVAGQAMDWSIAPGGVTLTRRSLLGARTQRLGPGDVVATEIRAVSWDSGADTYGVRLRLRAGGVLDTPDQPERQTAEAHERAIRKALGLG